MIQFDLPLEEHKPHQNIPPLFQEIMNIDQQIDLLIKQSVVNLELMRSYQKDRKLLLESAKAQYGHTLKGDKTV